MGNCWYVKNNFFKIFISHYVTIKQAFVKSFTIFTQVKQPNLYSYIQAFYFEPKFSRILTIVLFERIGGL